ncbi:DPP IV N-terminal domain-containing protein [Paraflavitalea speifideaquila]|uniref:DPP IV N-terminal domain-containing protein n=1 Tax=Paraflavitalea speifideaquila TaxID=3076558 RepID=UPI0028F082BA|nr:DPP IV N-terminal domain-containing protein [Paraflavitalea speifideiaquila]
MDRGHQRFRILLVDAANAIASTLLDEQTNTFIYNNRNFTHYLTTNQLIRTSEKNGWNHIYLVDLLSGKEQPVTTGNWVVRGVDSVDPAKKEIWFRASGMQAGEDPYNIHYYRISFDGRNLKALTPLLATIPLSCLTIKPTLPIPGPRSTQRPVPYWPAPPMPKRSCYWKRPICHFMSGQVYVLPKYLWPKPVMALPISGVS